MRILIAEDHQDLRELLTDLLASKGHTVVATKDGTEALRAFIDDGEFDFVITDYQMPRKNGVVLIMDIRKHKPTQKVLLVSGDPPQMTDIIRKEAGEFPILAKPYRNSDLFALLV